MTKHPSATQLHPGNEEIPLTCPVCKDASALRAQVTEDARIILYADGNMECEYDDGDPDLYDNQTLYCFNCDLTLRLHSRDGKQYELVLYSPVTRTSWEVIDSPLGQQARGENFCRGCDSPKTAKPNVGPVVCWSCWYRADNPFKSFDGTLEEWLAKIGR